MVHLLTMNEWMNIDRLLLTKTLSFLRCPVFLITILFLPSIPHCVQISCLLRLPSEVTASQAFLVFDDLDGFEEDLPTCFVEWPYITIWLKFSLLRTYCCCYKSLIIWLRWCLLGFFVAKLSFFPSFTYCTLWKVVFMLSLLESGVSTKIGVFHGRFVSSLLSVYLYLLI